MSDSKRESARELTPAAFHVLLALAAGERHGYAIMHDVAAFTDGALRLGPATLYRSIKQLLLAGLISEAAERPDPALDDERRRYYQLTDLGRSALRFEAERLEQLVAVARARRVLDRGERTPRVGEA
jgi:DNA-binding PadR family transcriptional regulator